VARLSVTLYRDGREPVTRVDRPSGDRLFDRSLSTLFGRSPYDHPLPPFPAGILEDSMRVRVGLGEEPGDSAGAAVVRFAAQQSPVRVTTGSLRVYRPSSGALSSTARPSAVVKYDIDPTGRIAAIQVLRSSNTAFSQSAVSALQGATFTPAQSNCRPISQSVVQSFGN
jgi:TonB family protein